MNARDERDILTEGRLSALEAAMRHIEAAINALQEESKYARRWLLSIFILIVSDLLSMVFWLVTHGLVKL